MVTLNKVREELQVQSVKYLAKRIAPRLDVFSIGDGT